LSASKKKHGGRKSVSAVKLSADKENVDNDRRMTIDADMFNDLLNNTSLCTDSPAPKRQTRSSSSKSSMPTPSPKLEGSKRISRTCSAKKQVVSSATETPDNRRMTMDAADLDRMLDDSCDSELLVRFPDDGRRHTVDSSDILRLLGEDQDSSLNGRESIMTVDLVSAVTNLLDKEVIQSSRVHENDSSCHQNDDSTVNCFRSMKREMADCSDLQMLVDGMDSTSETNKTTTFRRETVDLSDFHAMLEDSNNNSISICSDQRRITMNPADLCNLLNESSNVTGSEMLQQSADRRQTVDYSDFQHLLNDTSTSTEDLPSDPTTRTDASDCSVDGPLYSSSCDEIPALVSPVTSSRKKRRSSTRSPLRKTKSPDHGQLHGAISLDSPVRSKARLEAPKSALKSAAKPPLSTKKSVVFGSPTASEFNKGSPTTNLTPMSKPLAKAMFSMSGNKRGIDAIPENEETAENSRILDEWDRLSASENGSPVQSPEFVPPNSCGSKSSARRKSKLFADNDGSGMYGSLNSPDVGNTSATVQLPANLADLVALNNIGLESATKSTYYRPSISINDVSIASCTENLETSLQAMMYAVGADFMASGNTSAVSSDNSALHYSTSSASVSAHSLGTLIGNTVHTIETPISRVSDASMLSIDSDISYRASFVPQPDRESIMENSRTVELEGNLCHLIADLDSKVAQQSAVPEIYDANFEDSRCRLDVEASNMSEDDTEDDEIGSALCESAEESQLHIRAGEVLQNIANRSVLNEELNTSIFPRHQLERALPPILITTLDPIILPVAVTTTAVKGTDVLNRLRSLNSDARANSLKHCNTPLASASDMSVGMKRHQNLLMSAKKLPVARLSLDDRRHTLGIASSVPFVPEMKRFDFNVISAAAKPTIMQYLQSAINHGSFLVRLQSATRPSENLLAVSTAATLSESFSSITEAAFSECQSTVSSLRIQQHAEWTNNEPGISAHLAKINFLAMEAESQSRLEKCAQIGTQIWRKWEAQLNSIASESIKCSLRSSLTELESAQQRGEGLQSAGKIDALYKHINEVKLRLSQKQIQLDSVLSQQSEVLKLRVEKTTALASKVMPLPSETAQSTSSDTMTELVLSCKNSKKELNEIAGTVKLLNKITYAKVTHYTKDCVNISIAVSTKLAVTLKISLKCAEGISEISDVNVDLVSSTSNELDRVLLLSQAFFANVLANSEIQGPLSPESLNIIPGLSQLPRLLHQVRPLDTYCPDYFNVICCR
jgi:hypothetical protein